MPKDILCLFYIWNFRTLKADDESTECVAFVNEPTTYYIILIFGITFLVLYILAAFNSKRFGMKYILSKLFHFNLFDESFQLHLICSTVSRIKKKYVFALI